MLVHDYVLNFVLAPHLNQTVSPSPFCVYLSFRPCVVPTTFLFCRLADVAEALDASGWAPARNAGDIGVHVKVSLPLPLGKQQPAWVGCDPHSDANTVPKGRLTAVW